MALTPRGKAIVIGGAVVAVLVGGVGALALTGNVPAPLEGLAKKVGLPTPPEPCPLTGKTLPGDKEPPHRPALAIKVENTEEARPQAGLSNADLVVEEPVEGGVTRFIAVYQCHDAARVGPVRSARTTDPGVLVQLGRPLFGFAGGAPRVQRAVKDVPAITDVNYLVAVDEYVRDDTRAAPHNLYTTTKGLYAFAKKAGRTDPPEPVFSYDEDAPKGRRARSVHIPFSSYADVNWEWSKGHWLRFHGTEPHVQESGRQVSAQNVVIMQVEVEDSDIVDVAGYASPDVTLTGTGKAWVFRDGRMVTGRWHRDELADLTRFETRSGDEIAMRPGVTWIELVPSDVTIDFGKR